MKIIYPAILTPCVNKEGFTIEIPDLKGCVSEGDNLEDAIQMGTDAACGYIISEIEDGNELPKPTNQSKIKLKKNQLTSLVVCDTEAYEEKYSSKIIRKNVSIPAYLNTFGEIRNINFSKVLKDALMKMACM